MAALALSLTRPAALALAPLIAVQGRRVRSRTPVLPEAGGARTGLVGAGTAVPLRLLVLGESTAAGVGVADQRDGMGFRLAVELARLRGGPVSWHVVARTGATARVVTSQLVDDAPAGLDLVVIVLGVNDTLRLRSRRAWRAHITRLIATLAPRLAPNGRVVLVGVPDFGGITTLPHPLRGVLRLHGRALDGELASLARHSDRVTHLPAPALPVADAFATDRFHPNAATYAAWAVHLAREIGGR